MKIIATHDTDEELELLKSLAEQGHLVITQLNGRAVRLNGIETMTRATKQEVAEVITGFRYAKSETDTETEDVAENTSPEGTESPTTHETSQSSVNSKRENSAGHEEDNGLTSAKIYKYIEDFETRISRIEYGLRQAILPSL